MAAPGSGGALAEFREYPDGTQVAVQDTGACCQECGSRDVLSRYREYPDGTLVLVDSTGVCCGCATGTGRNPAAPVLEEYREYPDGAQVFVRNTGACCGCFPGDMCDPYCGCTSSPDTWEFDVSWTDADFTERPGTIHSMRRGGVEPPYLSCGWGGDDIWVCCGGCDVGGARLQSSLECDGTDFILRLVLSSALGCNHWDPFEFPKETIAVYKLPKASWNCNGNNTLNLDSVTGDAVWPNTVTLSPA
jgi:hypothetical protein